MRCEKRTIFYICSVVRPPPPQNTTQLYENLSPVEISPLRTNGALMHRNL